MDEGLAVLADNIYTFLLYTSYSVSNKEKTFNKSPQICKSLKVHTCTFLMSKCVETDEPQDHSSNLVTVLVIFKGKNVYVVQLVLMLYIAM